jgi:hypothetical protein
MKTKSIKKIDDDNLSSNIILLATTAVFHVILIFHPKIISWFYQSEIGGSLIAFFLIVLFGILFYSQNNPLRFTKKNKIIKKMESLDLQRLINLFLLFTIPISILGIITRIWVIQSIPLDSKIADVLPLIESAGRAFLQGYYPYQTYYVPHPLPLTFWPGLWMPFLPAIAFNFDPRWIGLIVWAIISIILILYSIRVSKVRSSSIVLLISAINILLLQISPELIAFQAYGHTFVLWLLLLIMGIALIEKRWLMSAILLGLVISSRQTAIIFIPILFALWYHQIGWKKAIFIVVLSCLTFGIIAIPFLLVAPEQFISIPIQHYKELGEYYVSIGNAGKVFETIGFSYLIQKYWGSSALALISAITVVGISLCSFIYVKSIKNFPLYVAFSIVLLTFFTPTPWRYEYFPALLFLMLANLV